MTDTIRPQTDDEWLSALLDGELSSADEQRLRERMAREPALAARFQQLRDADAALRGQLRADKDAPLPQGVDDLLARARRQADADHEPGARGGVIPFPTVVRQRWPMAAAASVALVVGVVIGQLWPGSSPRVAEPLALLGPGLVSEGSALHAAVSELPSGEARQVAGVTVTPRFSFQGVAGAPCRLVRLDDGSRANEAVVCREDNDWQVQMTAVAMPADGDEAMLRPATAPEGPMQRALTALMDGAPLGPQEEATLRERDWTPR